MIRLGGPVESSQTEDPQAWIEELKMLGYRAAFCPELSLERPEQLKLFRQAAENADIVIAEVGAWSNPLSRDEVERAAAIRLCQERLSLAQEVGARCCVNIAGSLGSTWDGPHPDHFTDETFALIVDSVREIIDAVKPSDTFYTLEMMPWMLPDSADTYIRLIKAIDRSAFGVHIDPVNVVTGPRLLYGTANLLKDIIGKLGAWIQSCHAKDITIQQQLTVHLDETRPGLGHLDYRAYLSLLHDLNRDVPLMLEHLPNQEEYRKAANYIRSKAGELGISL
ncbi:hypothetical protein Back11_20730 [Paenibacillus baekrokdamisoli]|uniref:Xylose isomerase-like TIM barrel domain-containing protein n=1 Tax=Paenibacillus baekrokdamisoli TaxID=1712516 RepID=A0A3G9JA12_9BACL|nr:sugar phosphate isomerase/epimerase family protein [Paenibacillus baekrokdamisoli]MBB3069918.1 sugar phosphate isomerase/epimerase [Paenibacillus baekrokdamisoli]BBH20728.1 hypothetical protein Back11_20730 [Paenibacillus baekrokdamisoli]